MIRNRPTKTVTASTYTTTDADNGYRIIFNNATGVAVTLHTATGRYNFDLEMDNIGAGNVTVNSRTISQYGHGHVGCDGTSWIVTVSGGGASGESPLTTKGDIYVYGSADDRLPVGTNGQVLKADSSQTLGVKWDASDAATNGLPTGGTADQILVKKSATDYDAEWRSLPQITRVALSSNFDVGTNTWTTMQWATEVQDDAGAFTSSANTKITVPTGKTKICLKAYVSFNAATGNVFAQIKKNGTGNAVVMIARPALYECGLLMDTGWISCTAGDYYEVIANSSSGADVLGSATWGGPCWFQAEFM